MIQKRVVFENLDAIKEKLIEVDRGEAEPVDTSGRRICRLGAAVADQVPAWKWHARRAGVRTVTLLYHDVSSRDGTKTSGFPGPRRARYKLEAREFDRHLRALNETTRSPPGRVADAWTAAKSRWSGS